MPKITNYFSSHQLLQKIDRSTNVITPNRRLAAALHKYYQQYQIGQRQSFWQTPVILPLSSWIERFYHELITKIYSDNYYLLNSAQEQFLWETILANAKENDFLLQISETAELAQSAWHLLKQWQIEIEHSAFNHAEDYAAFQRWAIQFQLLCKEKNWIEPSSIPDLITEKMTQNLLQPSAKIILFGFTDLSPQLIKLLQACEKNGAEIEQAYLIHTESKSESISLSDSEEELLVMAQWAKTLLHQYPSAAIGCVVPSLHQSRDRIKQIFSGVFSDNETKDEIETHATPFNISAGKSLIQYPIINTSLQLLALYKQSVPIEILSCLLTSPFIGEAEIERVKRAYFDTLLRQANLDIINITALIHEKPDAEELSLTKYCPALANRLRRFFSVIKEHNQKERYSYYADLFTQCLSILGWPGERSLNSDEYQIVEHWLQFLTEYTTLDYVAMPVNLSSAFQKLYKLASKNIFQPRSPEAPIQVLGILEAAGLPFDFLWVAGMDDLSWPPLPKPNAFIPKQIQREWHMPHATAEREHHFCMQITRQFKSSAKHTIFSYAKKNADIIHQPSPLIADLPVLSLSDLALLRYEPIYQRIYQTKKIEYIVDETAPIFLNEEKILGGVDIIKQQSLCPFKAFAKHRLKANELEVPLFGLRAKDRGNIIHKALEIIWNQLQNQKNLINLDQISLNKLLKHAIQDAMFVSLGHKHHLTSYFKKTYLDLEKQRLFTLLSAWMCIEKEREPFKVLMQEKTTSIILNELPITIRIDRIDELTNGQRIIIDYKTGKNNEMSSWFGERPKEPQLPLYSLIDSQQIAGIAFAEIVPANLSFKGVSRFSLNMRGIKLISEIKNTKALSWDEQINQWKHTLTQLSDDFYSGKAQVNPKDAQTCLWCALKPICRISEELPSTYFSDKEPYYEECHSTRPIGA